ncbi:hypothetical protein MtrunA17_Chr1g0183181 [Medicago truncatula]|nr:hypothetical protein MtrunA17_Chr1g0183181 [Medicago truncatula]
MFCLEFPSVGLLKLFLQPLKNLVVISLSVCSSVTLVACCSSVGFEELCQPSLRLCSKERFMLDVDQGAAGT